DRPDWADSAKTVGAGRFQLESGLNREADPIVPGTVITLPLRLRVGMGESWEARVSTDGPRWENPGGAVESLTGLQNIDLGAKWNFFREEGKTLEGLGFVG